MTATAAKGRTEWQAAQYAADHGRTTAIAVGLQCEARHVSACGAEDMTILGLREIPEPRPWMWPVTDGTDEQRRARVDAWAARHGIHARDDEASGQYRAVLKFGPVTLIAYTIPETVTADRVKYATERANALHTAVATMQPASAA